VLAVIGVVIGICAIIVMLSIGFGLQEGFKESLASWGNLHLITIYNPGGGGGAAAAASSASSGGNKKVVKLDDKAITAIEKIPGVAAATPRESAWLTCGGGKYIAEISVVGVRPEVLEKFGYELKEGRLLQQGDKNVILFGNLIPARFYNPKKSWGSNYDSTEAVVDVLTDKMVVTADYNYGKPQRASTVNPTEKIVYKEYKFKGVGVLEGPDDYDTAYYAFMPLKTVKMINEDQAKSEKRRYDRTAGYQEAMVYVENIEEVRGVSDAIRAMGFQTNSLTDALDMMQKQARMIQVVLGGIGAVSLLVAALGITNTMIMSIYERTKEIGVMKVLGANLPDIRSLFLIEAGLIGFVGGLVGIALSCGLSLLMNTALGPVIGNMLGGITTTHISIIPLWLPLAALGFATFIGIVSGYSPARRAMNLSALESLRNE
jgi:ABC-type antimicrobial peptide transport system permease subunit